MKATFFSAALVSLMTVVSALPAPGAYPDGTVVTVVDPADIPAYIKNPELATRDAAPALQKRANQGVFLCTGAGFTNYCVHIVNGLGEITNLSGDLNDQVTALGPDSGLYCLFYRAFGASDSEGHFGCFSPGYSNLANSEFSSFDNAISSYYCWNA
ncbi:hypothetical protein CJF30_00003541 [Rutstroemia sp. NJR-2017a BBW]|nr:hypothetical protein CJF30_00003541 [Rutstroemia sp. NJR-2017a BBW]